MRQWLEHDLLETFVSRIASGQDIHRNNCEAVDRRAVRDGRGVA
jgi:hypothetical protein